jgi:hypothetical protein
MYWLLQLETQSRAGTTIGTPMLLQAWLAKCCSTEPPRHFKQSDGCSFIDVRVQTKDIGTCSSLNSTFKKMFSIFL